MQSCQKFDFSDVNIPSEERKASVAVVNLTDDSGRQMFLSKTSSFINLYAVAAAFIITSAKIKHFISLLKIFSSRSERKALGYLFEILLKIHSKCL